jgi:PAS domain S-box-containing protein
MAPRNDRWLEPFRLKTVGIGAQAGLIAIAGLLVFRLLPGGDHIPTGLFYWLVGIGLLGTALVIVAPWLRLFEAGWGMPTLYAWSVVNIILIAIVVSYAADANPSLFGLYLLTTVFFAACYPPKVQAVFLVFTCAAYGVAVGLGPVSHISVADHFFRIVVLGVVALLASFLARELMEQMKEKAGAHAELKKEFTDLQRADEVFRAVSELASDFIYSLAVAEDGSTRWEWASAAFERVTGYPFEEGSLFDWRAQIRPEDLPIAERQFRRIMSGERDISEFRITTPRGPERHVRVYGVPVRDNGRVARIFGAVQDITASKQDEHALRSSNALLKATLEATADGILVVETGGQIAAFNQKFAEMWHIPEDVLATRDDGRALAAAIDQLKDPAAFLDKVRALYWDHEARELDVLEFKDGRTFERWSLPYRIEGEVAGRVWSFRDVSSQRREQERIAEAIEALRRSDGERRRLLTHLVRAKEDERSRVASDIHDDSVQVMTSLAIDLERLARQTDDPQQRIVLTRLEESARAAIKRLRSMVFELKPPTLAEEGLASALYLYLEELKADTGLDYELRNDLEGEPPEEMSVVLYRIAQEALTNVRKHARASKVRVELASTGNGVMVGITDDGIGFDHAGQVPLPGHLGIVEMREHALIASGSFRIRGAEPSGTRVEAWIPDRSGERAQAPISAKTSDP